MYHDTQLSGYNLLRDARFVKRQCNRLNLTPALVVGRGVSGTVFASAVVALYGNNTSVCVVRKRHSQHSVNKIEYSRDALGGEAIIVDDFVAEGNTLRTIKRNLMELNFTVKAIFLRTIGCRGEDRIRSTVEKIFPDIPVFFCK